jgi:hypothetical protein
LFNTSLVRRLSDNFVSLYSNNDLKRYDGADPLFSTLPKEISKILLHKFQEFLSYDFTEIAKHDPFEIPNGIQLFDPVEDEKDQENKNKEDDTDTKNNQQVRPMSFIMMTLQIIVKYLTLIVNRTLQMIWLSSMKKIPLRLQEKKKKPSRMRTPLQPQNLIWRNRRVTLRARMTYHYKDA